MASARSPSVNGSPNGANHEAARISWRSGPMKIMRGRSRRLPHLGQGEAVLGGDFGRALDEVLAHLVVGALLDLPLAEDLVVPGLRAAEELRQVRPVFVHGGLQPRLALRRRDQLGREVLAELRVEALLRHGRTREITQRMEGAVE